MSAVSKEQVEIRIRELLEQEGRSLTSLTLEDLLPVEHEEEIDLKSMFTTLEAIRTEFRQMNRTEKQRLDTFRTYFEEERDSKQHLLEGIDSLVSKAEFTEQKSILLSIIETRDFIEAYHLALPLIFKGKSPLLSLLYTFVTRRAYDYINENVKKTLKKIDQALEKAGVSAVESNHQIFDPATMAAVETTRDTGRPDLLVLDTLEKGYLHHGVVLRLAKVNVNRLEETH